MARPRKNMVDATEIIQKALKGMEQMEAPRNVEDPYGFEGWIRVGQAKELFRQILDACNMEVRDEE